MTAFWSAGNMVGVSKSLDFPGLHGVSGPGLLRDIDTEAGTKALSTDE